MRLCVLVNSAKEVMFHSVLQHYAKTTTTNFHKIAGKVAERAGCALWGGGLTTGRDMTI